MKDMQKQRKGSPRHPIPSIVTLPIRTNLHAGANCELGIQYWRSEYRRLKELASKLGCL